MTQPDSHLEPSYAFCHAVAKASRSSFYPCFIVLPKPRRQAMEVLYAFMRHTDDLADRQDVSAEQRLADLNAWRSALELALHQGATDCSSASAVKKGTGSEPTGETTTEKGDREVPVPFFQCKDNYENILPALADCVDRFSIPFEHLFAVIDGVEMDVHGRTYATFDELAEYCHRVASAVGLACLYIWGFHGPLPTEAARACGLAFQLTNILRDLKEDAELGRVYLPEEELRRFDYSAEALHHGEANEPFMRLMRFEIERAEQLYRDGARLFEQLERPGQRIFGLMFSVYRRLLATIQQDPAGVLRGRVRLGRGERLRLAGRWLLLPPSARALP